MRTSVKNFHGINWKWAGDELVVCLTEALERLTELKMDGCFQYHYNRRLLAEEMGLM